MCGTKLAPMSSPEEEKEPAPPVEAPETEPAATSSPEAIETPSPSPQSPAPEEREQQAPDVVESVMQERQSPVTFWLTAVFVVIIIVLGGLILRYQGPAVSIALVPSPTPLPPTLTFTPTWTPLPTETSLPTNTPTITPTPAPTNTPRPTRLHSVASGETFTSLSLRYRVSAESIAIANGLTLDSPVQAGRELIIPWPTATPPLESMAIEINSETVIADVTDCEIYEIQPDDTVFGIAAAKDVPLEAIIAVNRQTMDSIQLVQPGDTLCIPEIKYGEALPPTPGPSPTPTPTSPPVGPHLLYPVDEAVIDPPDGIVTLQWTAVKDLAEDEWYMVELKNMDEVDAPFNRGFTRDTALQLPAAWRPTVPESQLMRWRVSIVRVTGWRSDGYPIYTYGGEPSADAYFMWLGAIPTPTPTPTLTATPSP